MIKIEHQNKSRHTDIYINTKLLKQRLFDLCMGIGIIVTFILAGRWCGPF